MYKTLRERINSIKDIIRNPFAWPGGYEKVLITKAGECLCHTCVKDNYREIIQDTKWDLHSGWEAIGIELVENFDETPCYCSHCSKQLNAPEY